MKSNIKKTFKNIKQIERLIISIIFLLMVSIFFFGIVVRELPSELSNKFSWIEEVVGIMNIFLVFMTLGLALEKGKHVRIPLILEKLGEKNGLILMKIIDTVGLVFSAYLFFISVQLMIMVFNSGQMSSTLNISMAIIYLAPAVGFLSLSCRYLFSLMGFINRFPTNNQPS
ncbi:TRAP transporter small permease [Vibrio sp. MA40-2]|uniref:TRAP transporter small permease n=1 Tax=Vibrio sp. MA40-2 TaxID=3391828 RepID=UPI0039A5E264